MFALLWERNENGGNIFENLKTKETDLLLAWTFVEHRQSAHLLSCG